MEAISLSTPSETNSLQLVQSPATPASYVRRIGAYLVDLFVIALLHFSTNLIFVLVLDRIFPHSAKNFVLSENFSTYSQASDLFCYLGYFTLTVWYFNGFTAGKRLFQIRISTHESEISLKQALFRTVSYGLSYLTLSFGFLLPLFREDQRALHDLLAQTTVSEYR